MKSSSNVLNFSEEELQLQSRLESIFDLPIPKPSKDILDLILNIDVFVLIKIAYQSELVMNTLSQPSFISYWESIWHNLGKTKTSQSNC